jgi:signal transduction histidine kinase
MQTNDLTQPERRQTMVQLLPPLKADITPAMAIDTLERENAALREEIAKLRRTVEQHERSVVETDTIKNAIVRNVSHELKTPLVQVKSAVALLKEVHGESKLVEYATTATARLESLIHNITQLAQSLEIELAPTALQESIDFAMRNVRRSWEHKTDSERITMSVPRPLSLVLADKQAIGRALHLLLDNALKFSKEYVHLKVEEQATVVQVTVQDFGIGIPQEKLDTIFDAFVQGDGSSTRRYGGAGVGLWIVKQILEKHGTTIHVDSKLNSGSSFWFELPKMKLDADMDDTLPSPPIE